MKTNKSLHTQLRKRCKVSDFARFLCMSRQGLYKAFARKRNLWPEYIEYIRKDVYMLGQKVYYIDLEENNVSEGTVLGLSIDHNGYCCYRLKTDEGEVYKIKPYVYPDKNSAQTALEIMYPKAEKMWKIRDEAQSKIDALREDLNGKPEYKVEDYYGQAQQ